MVRHKRAGVILYDADNEVILLIRGNPTGLFSIPKGHAEHGETLHETALRELREETGIKINIDAKYYRINASRVCYFMYVVSIEDVPIGMPLTPTEVQSIGWYNLKDVNVSDCNSSLRTILKTDLKAACV